MVSVLVFAGRRLREGEGDQADDAGSDEHYRQDVVVAVGPAGVIGRPEPGDAEQDEPDDEVADVERVLTGSSR